MFEILKTPSLITVLGFTITGLSKLYCHLVNRKIENKNWINTFLKTLNDLTFIEFLKALRSQDNEYIRKFLGRALLVSWFYLAIIFSFAYPRNGNGDMSHILQLFILFYLSVLLFPSKNGLKKRLGLIICFLIPLCIFFTGLFFFLFWQGTGNPLKAPIQEFAETSILYGSYGLAILFVILGIFYWFGTYLVKRMRKLIIHCANTCPTDPFLEMCRCTSNFSFRATMITMPLSFIISWAI